jgi:hypothetical protein
MSGGVLFLYVDAKSVECNEAYESFSAACYFSSSTTFSTCSVCGNISKGWKRSMR